MFGMPDPTELASHNVCLWPSYKHQSQGRTNACGPASLAMAVSRLSNLAITVEQTSRIMAPIRAPLILATPPWSMELTARLLGYQCRTHWRGRLDDLAHALLAGRSVIVMVRPIDFAGRFTWTLHYRAVAAIEADGEGQQWVWLACSALARDESKAGRRTQPANVRLAAADFLRQWTVAGVFRWMLELWPG